MERENGILKILNALKRRVRRVNCAKSAEEVTLALLRLRKYASPVIFLFCFHLTIAQPYAAVQKIYQNTIGTSSLLFTGKEFTDYPSYFEGNPFFGEDWSDGSVLYDGIRYNDVSIRYDEVADALLIDHKSLRRPIQLESSRVEWFSVLGHHFIRAQNGTVKGFFDELADGKVKLLIKRKKSKLETINEQDRTVTNLFEDQTEFYIVRNKLFYKIKSKGALLSVLADHKKELKKFMNREVAKFSREPEEFLLQAVNHYNQL